MHLAKRLTEELANQAQHNSRSYGLNRSASPEPEQHRSRSYDHKSPQKSKGKLFIDKLEKIICKFNLFCANTPPRNIITRAIFHLHSLFGKTLGVSLRRA